MRRTSRLVRLFAVLSLAACVGCPTAPAGVTTRAEAAPADSATAQLAPPDAQSPKTTDAPAPDRIAATRTPVADPARPDTPPPPPEAPVEVRTADKSAAHDLAKLDSLGASGASTRGAGGLMGDDLGSSERGRIAAKGKSAMADPVLDFDARGPMTPMKREAEKKPAKELAALQNEQRRAAPKPTVPTSTPANLAPAADESGDSESSFQEGGEFASAGVNPLVDAKTDPLSTFAIDVDTGAYSLARRYLNAGSLPPSAGVRVEEWVNAFHYSYPDKSAEHPFSIHVEAAPLARQSQIVRIGIQGKRVEKADREPVHLTFLVDVSGSMSPSDRLPMAKRALTMLVEELNAKDSVSIVTYAGSTQVVLPATDVTAQHRGKILDAIESLRNGGGTNMGSGMELAYREATKALAHKGSSRVIVLSDGDANIGHTGHQQMLKAIKGYVSEGVTMSTVGFGTGNYRDHLMEQLADAGNGNYSYVGSLTDAKKIFVDDLTGTLQVIAKDTKIQVEMNPAVVAQYRLIGYENRDVHDEDFRNDKVDAGEIGAGHTVTALYEVVLANDGAAGGTLCTVHVRYKDPKGTKGKETALTFATSQIATDVRSLSADGRFAVGVGLAAESMRHSQHMDRLGLTLADAHALMTSAQEGPFAGERKELAGLIAPLAGGAGVARR